MKRILSVDNGTIIEVERQSFEELELNSPLIKVSDFSIKEHPQAKDCDCGLLNVGGRCWSVNGNHIGVCVMIVGCDALGKILWACCAMGQCVGEKPGEMFESLLMTPESFNQTSRITIRVHSTCVPSKAGGIMKRILSVDDGTIIEVERQSFEELELNSPLIKVSDFSIKEHPQAKDCDCGLLNVGGRCWSVNGNHIGVCVMIVGCDALGKILWACCAMGQCVGEKPGEMFESLLMTPESFNQTSRITIRVHSTCVPSKAVHAK